MNKLMITRVSIRPNKMGNSRTYNLNKRRGVRNHNTSEMMQTMTHKLKRNTIQMLYNINKHKMNNLIKYTTEEHTGYVTAWISLFCCQAALTHLSICDDDLLHRGRVFQILNFSFIVVIILITIIFLLFTAITRTEAL